MAEPRRGLAGLAAEPGSRTTNKVVPLAGKATKPVENSPAQRVGLRVNGVSLRFEGGWLTLHGDLHGVAEAELLRQPARGPAGACSTTGKLHLVC